ncbi:hypothetical protein L207DRAFT_636751 [Hyaloscypha variabilis F]|uniref:Zn(2)-C6 fungal-type domain-containing protein n=1 Tax=Hyaloscypha variabilis (strain UAMH 11265 / GT02V1 / F) TaxID=1149755 RepID=A0A2J6RE87_HYAVF|nr:hypothetical protein L207DRAFT_636751 [Hyaloscypha variabilis F]
MVGKPKSCTACRQAKMGCDARTKAPNPCSRCKSNKLECCFVKNFKRLSTRQIARDLANELHIVRASQSPDEQITPPSNRQSASLCASDARSVFLMSIGVDPSTDFSLGGVSISLGDTLELLQHFEKHYYPYATFVAPVQSLAHLVSNSPLLFWTIILIASQHHHLHSHLYEDLYFPHQQLLTPLLNISIRSIENVHAIILLCLWPIPRRRILHDPSWTYIGIAVNSSMTLNCHKPPAQKHTLLEMGDLSGSVEVHTKYLTWLACFSVGTQIATFIGFVPPISSSHQLKYVSKAIDQLYGILSTENHASFAICEIICNYSISLEDVEDLEAYISLVNEFDGRLDTIKQTYLAHWTPEIQIQLQFAKLNLYAASALLPLGRTSLADAQIIINRQALFLRGMESAITLIDHMKNMAISTGNEGQYHTGKLPFLPKHFFTSLFFSAAFLFRSFIYLQPIGHTHIVCAIQGMRDAQLIFSLLPHHRDHARAARIIGILVENAQTVDTASDRSLLGKLIVTNRLGASIMWEIFARMKMNMNSERNNCEGRATKKTRMIGPDPLPLAPEMKQLVQNCWVPFITAPAAEEQEAGSWGSWDVDLDDFGFAFDQQMPWQV